MAGLREINGLDATRGETAYRDGVGPFLGALLGTSLEATRALPLARFAQLIVLLATLVMSVQIIGNARSRAYSVVSLAILGVTLWALAHSDTVRPPALPRAGWERTMVMLGIPIATPVSIALIRTRPHHSVLNTRAGDAPSAAHDPASPSATVTSAPAPTVAATASGSGANGNTSA